MKTTAILFARSQYPNCKISCLSSGTVESEHERNVLFSEFCLVQICNERANPHLCGFGACAYWFSGKPATGCDAPLHAGLLPAALTDHAGRLVSFGSAPDPDHVTHRPRTHSAVPVTRRGLLCCAAFVCRAQTHSQETRGSLILLLLGSNVDLHVQCDARCTSCVQHRPDLEASTGSRAHALLCHKIECHGTRFGHSGVSHQYQLVRSHELDCTCCTQHRFGFTSCTREPVHLLAYQT